MAELLHSDDEEIVLARVSWRKFFVVLSVPVAVLSLGYALFSERSLAEVFSYENLTATTPWRPYLPLTIIFISLFFGMIAYRATRMASSKGKYISVRDGVLLAYNQKMARIRDLDPQRIEVKGGTLVAPRIHGGEIRLSLSLADYDESLAATLRDLVRSERSCNS